MLLTGTPISNSTKDLLTIAVVALKEVVCHPRSLLDGLQHLQPDVRRASLNCPKAEPCLGFDSVLQVSLLLLELARKLVLRRRLADVFPDMPAKHEFVVVCPATPLLLTLVKLSHITCSGTADAAADAAAAAHADGWRLDHTRLIGGVNNTVQRRLLCR